MGGGIGLALACDLRYASASARFRMPAARLGLGYSYADMRRLAGVVGAASAFDLFYTARILDAEQAERRGLVHERYADDDFVRQSQARVRAIAAPLPARGKGSHTGDHESARARAARCDRRPGGPVLRQRGLRRRPAGIRRKTRPGLPWPLSRL
jgi:enoyl-CoA hydratase/carnithine racemase